MEHYENLSMEVILFEADDIITDCPLGNAIAGRGTLGTTFITGMGLTE